MPDESKSKRTEKQDKLRHLAPRSCVAQVPKPNPTQPNPPSVHISISNPAAMAQRIVWSDRPWHDLT